MREVRESASSGELHENRRPFINKEAEGVGQFLISVLGEWKK